MTAHHIRQRIAAEKAAADRQELDASGEFARSVDAAISRELTPEEREYNMMRAMNVIFTDAAPPYVDPYDAPNLQSGYVPPTMPLDESVPPITDYLMFARLFQAAKEVCACSEFAEAGLLTDLEKVVSEIEASDLPEELPSEPAAADPLSGLGLSAGDLAAIQGQVAAVIRPMMRDHYRAQFMSAVIQGIMGDNGLAPEQMAKTAARYADAALKEMGL